MNMTRQTALFRSGSRYAGYRRLLRAVAGYAVAAYSGGLDLLYPRVCAGCGADMSDGDGLLCWECIADLTFIRDPFCERCGDPVDGMVGHSFECSWCRETHPAFTRARSAVRFRGPVRDVLHKFKYNAQTHLAVDLGALLAGCVEAHYLNVQFDGITYVPLHPRKGRERSFNQAALLAVNVGRRLKIPVLYGCLRRIRFTKTQTTLTAAERKANVRGAFSVAMPEWVRERRILLIDDVMTTGATVNACAEVLMEAGALSVHIATVARG